MIGYNIIHYLMDITNTHSYTINRSYNCNTLEAILQLKQMQKSQLLGKYLARSNYSPETTS